MLRSHHRRTSFLIHSPDLLYLFTCQAELREKVRPSIAVIVRRASTRRWAVLAVRQTREREECCK
jgi:hypothetical protein